MNLEQLTVTIWVVFAGICCAAFYAYYQRCLLGDIVRALLACEAYDAQSAKTLTELGYGSGLRRAFALRALRKGTALRKSVHAVYPEMPPQRRHKDEIVFSSRRQSASASSQRYYIPEELRHAAEVRYDAKGTSAVTVIGTVAAFFVAAVILIALLPWIRDTVASIGTTDDRSENAVISPSETYETDIRTDVDISDSFDSSESLESPDSPESVAHEAVSDESLPDDQNDGAGDGVREIDSREADEVTPETDSESEEHV